MKNTSIFSFAFGSHKINYSFLVPETGRRFKDYIHEAECGESDISISRSIFESEKETDRYSNSDDYIEFFGLLKLTANWLLKENCAIFHAAAFLWKEKAWLITAPSGTGKTTQLRHWGRQFRNEIKVINGDKPIIECRPDGTAWVYSSPWTGKEGYGKPGMVGELGGIIMLEQGKENMIRKLEPDDYVYPLFRSFLSMPETVEEIRQQARILDQMVSQGNVWKLINKGDTESAKLTHDTLEKYLEGEYV